MALLPRGYFARKPELVMELSKQQILRKAVAPAAPSCRWRGYEELVCVCCVHTSSRQVSDREGCVSNSMGTPPCKIPTVYTYISGYLRLSHGGVALAVAHALARKYVWYASSLPDTIRSVYSYGRGGLQGGITPAILGG